MTHMTAGWVGGEKQKLTMLKLPINETRDGQISSLVPSTINYPITGRGTPPRIMTDIEFCSFSSLPAGCNTFGRHSVTNNEITGQKVVLIP